MMSTKDTKTGVDLFDQWAAEPGSAGDAEAAESVQPGLEEAQSAEPSSAMGAVRTPVELRRALLDLLKHGWLEKVAKPRLFATIQNRTSDINHLLEPLDLQVQIDEARGLAYVTVLADDMAGEEVAQDDAEDGWSHPLVFRQRLTLEQSLLVAILRREFIQQEQEGGLGVTVRIAVEDLQPQLDVFMDRSGSDAQDRKRLMQLLDNLRKHGMVSEVDAQDYVLIRPMIVHLANPENLQALLQHLQSVVRGQQSNDSDAVNVDGEDA